MHVRLSSQLNTVVLKELIKYFAELQNLFVQQYLNGLFGAIDILFEMLSESH